MTTALFEVIYLFETYCGLCVMCGGVYEVRPLPGGSPSDGICQACDRIRFDMLNPTREWKSWEKRKAESVARKLSPVRSGAPAVQAAAGTPLSARRAS